MNRSAAIALVSCIPLLACAATSRGADVSFVPSSEYELSISPNLAQQTFDLTLRSKSQTSICIDLDQWPNNLGQVAGGGERAKVIASGRTFPAVDHNFGYCIGKDCQIRVSAGGYLEGHIGFSEFPGWNWQRDLRNSHVVFLIKPWRHNTC
jgi:hypothetical protein